MPYLDGFLSGLIPVKVLGIHITPMVEYLRVQGQPFGNIYPLETPAGYLKVQVIEDRAGYRKGEVLHEPPWDVVEKAVVRNGRQYVRSVDTTGLPGLYNGKELK